MYYLHLVKIVFMVVFFADVDKNKPLVMADDSVRYAYFANNIL